MNEHFGNRGITLIKDINVYTPFGSLSTATPSVNNNQSYLDQALFNETHLNGITIWLKGFFHPQKDSAYEFGLETNGEAILYFSNNRTSENKVLDSQILILFSLNFILEYI